MVATLEVLHDLNRLCPSVFPEVIEFRGALYDEFIRRVIFDEWEGMHDEYLVVGGAGTGKTSALAFFFHWLQKRFPGAKGLILRENRVDLNESFMETFEEEVLDYRDMTDSYVLFNGQRKRPNRENRKHYLYPPDQRTGRQSRTVLGGMDKWERFRSTRWDWIGIIEATEVAKDNIEGIQRSMRPQRKRPGDRDVVSILPKRIMVMETNPDGPEHQLRKRADRGVCHEIITTIRDNPAFWDRSANDYTEAGAEYVGRMTRGMSGHIYKRLVLGQWAGAVGGIFDMWSRQTHVVHANVVQGDPNTPDRIVFTQPHEKLGGFVDIHWYVGGYDQGLRNAGTLSVWAVDGNERAYLVYEVYEPNRGIEWWAQQVVDAYARFPMRSIACEHNWYFINRFNDELHKANVARFGSYNASTYVLPEMLDDERAAALFQQHKVNPSKDVGGRVRIATNATKGTTSSTSATNLELLRRQMMPGLDGVPRLMVLSNALGGTRPPDLDQDRPWGVVEEFERAVWAKQRMAAESSVPKDEIDKGCDDHGIDAAAYAMAFAYGRNIQRPTGPSLRKARPGTFEFEEERRPGKSLFGSKHDDDEEDERESTWS